MIVPKKFYIELDVNEIAKSLLGKLVVTKVKNKFTSGIIVETEAYKAPEDKASHAYGNKRTPRTETMFEEGGCSYIYLCYGIHEMFNVVSGPQNTAHAILVRALEPVEGISHMEHRRKKGFKKFDLCNGPGKLCQALAISRDLNRVQLHKPDSPIQIHDLSYDQFEIDMSPRVGVAYAGECASWPWRYKIKNNLYTSKPAEVFYP